MADTNELAREGLAVVLRIGAAALGAVVGDDLVNTVIDKVGPELANVEVVTNALQALNDAGITNEQLIKGAEIATQLGLGATLATTASYATTGKAGVPQAVLTALGATIGENVNFIGTEGEMSEQERDAIEGITRIFKRFDLPVVENGLGLNVMDPEYEGMTADLLAYLVSGDTSQEADLIAQYGQFAGGIEEITKIMEENPGLGGLIDRITDYNQLLENELGRYSAYESAVESAVEVVGPNLAETGVGAIAGEAVGQAAKVATKQR